MTHSGRIGHLVTYGLLAGAAGFSFLLPDQLTVPRATAAAGPAQIHLTGIVHDFLESYPDMEVMPGGGFGHYAGSVDVNLDADNRPAFVEPGGGGGFSVPTTNVVAHWTFDDGSGGTAADGEGPNNGTLMNGPTWTTGPEGGALRFDGANDYVNVPSAPELRVTGDMTIAGWFKLDQNFNASSPTSQILVERYQDDEHNMMIALIGADCKRPDLPKGSMCFKVEHGPTGFEFRYKWTNRRSWTAGTWYHFACTINSADSASNDMIIDGVDDTDPTNLGSLGLINTDYPADMRIGGKNGDFYVIPEGYLKGVMDDVMMYNVALVEDDFTGTTGGFKVTTQWKDTASQPIAPHLFDPGVADGDCVGIRVDGTITLGKGTIDGFDSDLGLYGVGGNEGAPVMVATNATGSNEVTLSGDATIYGDVFVGPGGNPSTVIDNSGTITGTTGTGGGVLAMPTVVEPTDAVVGPNTGNQEYKDDPFTISSNKHFDNLRIKSNAVVTISGNVTMLVEEDFKSETGGSLVVPDGSSLDLYLKGNLSVKTESQWSNPKNTRVWVIGSPDLVLETESAFSGTIIAPEAKLLVKTKSALFGSFVGKELEVITEGAVHVDLAGSGVFGCDSGGGCGVASDTPGTAGSPDSGGITDASSFESWYREAPGANEPVGHVVTMTDDGTGVFEFLTNGFYPIDGRLLGNEGHPHNYHFTYQLAADFTFAECTGQFIEFEGGDGAWIFVDGFLAIDLGGMATATTQYVDIDRLKEDLGLVDGESYRMHLFYAHRTASSPSTFKLRTNILLSTEWILPTIGSAFD